ncbi:perforin-like protein 1 [Rhopilema esculentum]|uniref:perforin-like protein 1 n=1 Tax=Rhopilema esculentum TaxID=499914 RepID=UPI0031D66A11
MIRLLFLILGLLAVAFAVEGENEVERKKDNSDVGEESSGAIGNELEKRGDKTMPNIGYLFKGYNVLEGNPMDPEKFDPGFRAKIFQASYQQDRLTDDRQFKIPDNVDLDEKEACSSSFSAESVMTESDYQKSLMAKAAVSGSGQVGVVEASFSASTEYTEMSKSLKSNTKSVIKTEATCIVYEARVQTGTPPEFTANFLETVKRLGQDPEGYGRFLDTFGTHFVETVDMGARYAKLQIISKSNQEKLSKSGIDVKFAAEASAAGIGSAKAEFQFKVDEEQKNKFEKSVETTKTVTIGSRPPANGDHDAWMQASVENPMPTYYRLKSILDVFRPAFFKDDSVDYRKIRTELSQYLQGYCSRLKKTQFPNVACEGPSKGCAGGTQCSVNAICTDNTNSGDQDHLYNCKCKDRYEGDGKLCERKLQWQLTDEIKQEENRGGWGTWGTMDYCDNGVFANGFLLKAEKPQGSSDDTGANAVCLQCGDRQKCSNKGPWGDWSDKISCPEGSYLSGWRQNVEDPIGKRDDTALDNVEYRCRDIETWKQTKQIKTKAEEWGRWSRFQECRRGEFICGIKTRVESPGGDDTALNDIIHQCCKPVLDKKKDKKFKYGRRS